MCGIFAYLGPKINAPELVIEGLKKLEYRGYDSWGVAAITSNQIDSYKKVGKISEFQVGDHQFPESQIA
ncbi:glutamine--fructose-6-phosphate aminotransferase, partial [Candidatus Peregrinibacteria bacterium]|nr:glutamine--fructose-6-phosphate aminotransferase [Candidatus Peregrinibacteria bacterium]